MMDSGLIRNMLSTLSNKFEIVHLVGFHCKNIIYKYKNKLYRFKNVYNYKDVYWSRSSGILYKD
jgi:hypothetical protein